MMEVAIASRIADAALELILGDSRVVLMYDRLWEVISEEL